MGTPTFHLYLDDSGTRFPDRKLPIRRDGMDYFAIGGLLIPSDRTKEAVEAHAELIARYDLSGPLHSNSIRVAKGEYCWLNMDSERAKLFLNDLERVLCNLPGYAIACAIHRPGYNARYKPVYGAARWDLCKSAYPIVVERAAKFALQANRRLMVYVERTGKREDRAIRGYHNALRESGMYFNPEKSKQYDPLDAQKFANALFHQPSFLKKTHPLAQFSDLLLYPLVKGRYDPTYTPYCRLRAAGRIIDHVLPEDDLPKLGVKYYCFDDL